MALVATIDQILPIPAGTVPVAAPGLDTQSNAADRVYLHWTYTDDADASVPPTILGTGSKTYARPFPGTPAATVAADIRAAGAALKQQLAAQAVIPANLLGFVGTVVTV